MAYLRKLGKEHIALMGSSTGAFSWSCQAPDIANLWDPGCRDFMRYMEDDPTIHAYILQDPTSDRLKATTAMGLEDYQHLLEYITKQIEQSNLWPTVPRELVPTLITEPVAMHRWFSLIAPGNVCDGRDTDREQRYRGLLPSRP